MQVAVQIGWEHLVPGPRGPRLWCSTEAAARGLGSKALGAALLGRQGGSRHSHWLRCSLTGGYSDVPGPCTRFLRAAQPLSSSASCGLSRRLVEASGVLAVSVDSPACTEDSPCRLEGSRTANQSVKPPPRGRGDAPRVPRQQVCSTGIFTALTCHRRAQPSATQSPAAWACAEATEGRGAPRTASPPPKRSSYSSAAWPSPPIPHPLAPLVGGPTHRLCTLWARPCGCCSQCWRQRDPRQWLPVLRPALLSGSLRPSPAGGHADVKQCREPRAHPHCTGPFFARQAPGRLGRSCCAAYVASEPRGQGRPRAAEGPGPAEPEARAPCLL